MQAPKEFFEKMVVTVTSNPSMERLSEFEKLERELTAAKLEVEQREGLIERLLSRCLVQYNTIKQDRDNWKQRFEWAVSNVEQFRDIVWDFHDDEHDMPRVVSKIDTQLTQQKEGK